MIAPGGALRALAFDKEGVRLAEWLTARGIAGFVLKYRTLQQDPAAPRRPARPEPGSAPTELVIVNGNANPAPGDEALAEVLRLAVADAEAALRLVRRRAGEWRIDPQRVGIIGFSAGGGVAVGAALAAQSNASPEHRSVCGGSGRRANRAPSLARWRAGIGQLVVRRVRRHDRLG